MILRREFFKKVLIGSIFALQFTVTGPVYNALAVGPSTDKASAEESIPSNAEVNNEAVATENGSSYKSKKYLDKHYSNLLKKHYKEIENKEEEFKRNKEKSEKINLNLISNKLTTEERQAIQGELNNLKERNKKLIDDVSEIAEKIQEIQSQKDKIAEDAEKEKAKKAQELKKLESDKKVEEHKKSDEAKKFKEETLKKYYKNIEDIEKNLEINKEKLSEINLCLTSDKLTKEAKQALQKQLNDIKVHNQKLKDDITRIKIKIFALKFEDIKMNEDVKTAKKAKKAEEFRKAEEAEKGYKTANDSNEKEWKLYSYKNDHDLTVKILTDEDFLFNWASIADKLGFRWCGGTKTPWVGEDFSIEKTDDNEYTLSANYNPSDPYTQGEAASERLKIKVNNIRFFIDGDSVEYGDKKILSVKPITVSSETFRNEDDEKPLTGEFGFEYSKTTSIIREDKFDFSQEIGIDTSFTTCIPKIASNETTVNVKVDFGKGWSDTKEIFTTKTYTKKITVEIAPKHKQRVELVATEQKLEIPYEANIYMSYNVALEGFLRREGNAHVNHPTDSPYVIINFPDNYKEKNAVDFIRDIYTNRHISGYSQWDFKWVNKEYGINSIINNINALSQYKVGGVIEGVFIAVYGTEEELISRDQVPLSTPDTKEEGSSQESIVFKARESKKLSVN